MIEVVEERTLMSFRILIWSVVGAFVVVLWTAYITATSWSPSSPVWALAYLPCPVALAHRYELNFYGVLVANAATYALVGAVVETLRRHRKPRAA